jgi:hypothetical protein
VATPHGDPPRPPKPKAELPAARDLQAGARRRGSRVDVSVGGRVKPPAGVACGGRVDVIVKKKTRQISKAAAKVDAGCAFKKRIRVPAAKLRRTTKLAVTLRFLGVQRTYIIRIRR